VIKQVTRTELDSFEDYAVDYFKYLTDSVSSGSPTCLTKVLGLYQVRVTTTLLLVLCLSNPVRLHNEHSCAFMH
jgi:hypothetical protein